MSSEEILRWWWAGGLGGCRGRAKIKIFFSSALAVVVCLACGGWAVGASSCRCCCLVLLAEHKANYDSLYWGTGPPTVTLPCKSSRLAKFGGCATAGFYWPDWPPRPTINSLGLVDRCGAVVHRSAAGPVCTQ